MKRNSKSAISYLFRNFGNLFYIVLPVAVLMSLFLNPINEVDFVVRFLNGNISDDVFWVEFNSAFSLIFKSEYWYLTILTLILFALSQCLLVVKLDHHMRIGEMYVFPLGKALRLFPLMFLYVCCVYLSLIIVSYVAIGVCYLSALFFSVKVTFAIVCIFVFVVQVLVSYLFATLLVAFPIKYSESYTFSSALSYSVRITSKAPQYVWLFAVSYTLLRLTAFIIGIVLYPYGLQFVPFAVLFVFFTAYLPCFAYRLFYDSLGGARRDLPTVYIG